MEIESRQTSRQRPIPALGKVKSKNSYGPYLRSSRFKQIGDNTLSFRPSGINHGSYSERIQISFYVSESSVQMTSLKIGRSVLMQIFGFYTCNATWNSPNKAKTTIHFDSYDLQLFIC